MNIVHFFLVLLILYYVIYKRFSNLLYYPIRRALDVHMCCLLFITVWNSKQS